MKRIALGIEYNGQDYYGWQSQRNLPTIQSILEDALAKVANETIYIHCAGRTDAHVHALNQVIHFDTTAKRHIDAWIWGVNSYLPPTIKVKWAQHVDFNFHARFKATARRYRYIILNTPTRPALMHGRVTWHYYPLDIDAMRAAATHLLGEKNFNSFRSSKCNSKTPMRNIYDIEIKKEKDFIMIEIEANAFLHHMVRNITGVMFKIGGGTRPVEWVIEVLNACDRRAAAETAPPDGLYLISVSYPSPYCFHMNSELILL